MACGAQRACTCALSRTSTQHARNAPRAASSTAQRWRGNVARVRAAAERAGLPQHAPGVPSLHTASGKAIPAANWSTKCSRSVLACLLGVSAARRLAALAASLLCTSAAASRHTSSVRSDTYAARHAAPGLMAQRRAAALAQRPQRMGQCVCNVRRAHLSARSIDTPAARHAQTPIPARRKRRGNAGDDKGSGSMWAGVRVMLRSGGGSPPCCTPPRVPLARCRLLHRLRLRA